MSFIINPYVFGISIDPDAQAFFNRVTAAGGTLTSTEQTAVNQLVLSMKSANVWTSLNAIYPMVGASAAACAQNLKSSSFTATFFGGWTFSSTGITPNGVNAYMDTFLTPSISLSVNNTHLSFYSRSSIIINGQRDMGVFVNGSIPCIVLGTNTGVQLSDSYSFLTNRISTSIANALGFVCGSRISNIIHKLYKNGIQIGSTDTFANVNSLPTQSVYIGAANLAPNPAIAAYSTKECAFASIGNGLTDTQSANFYTAVQTFQTTLSRQV